MSVKPRHPVTFKGALTRILGALGLTASSVVGRSDSLVRAWADPDRIEYPSIENALQLDIAMVHAVGVAPIFDVYRQLLEDATRDVAHAAQAPEARMLQVVAELGELSGGLAAGFADGRLTLDEARHLQRDVAEAIEKLSALSKDIDARLALQHRNDGGRA